MKHSILNIALAVGIAAMLSSAYLLDGPDDHSTEWALAETISLAQKAAQLEARQERAAAQLCMKLKGPNAGYRWTGDNQLVCTTNKGRNPVVAVKGVL